MFDAPPGAGPFEALLRDIAMRAFDLAGADRQIVGQGVTIVQVVRPIAQIEMASPHRRLIVVCVGRFDAGSERAFIAVAAGLDLAGMRTGTRLALSLDPQRLYLFGTDGMQIRGAQIS